MRKHKSFLFKEAAVLSTFTVLIPTFITVTNLILKRFGVTQKAMLLIIYFSYFLHIFLYLAGTPFLQCFFSVSIQILIHKLIKNLPLISSHSFSIKFACIAFITNSMLMMLSFINSRAGILKMVVVYLISGITPLIFFTHYWFRSLNV